MREEFRVPNYSKLAAEYRRRAAEARRWANAADNSAKKVDLLQIERRWLRLARNHEAKLRPPSKGKPRRKSSRKD
jgi:hypothetical protein